MDNTSALKYLRKNGASFEFENGDVVKVRKDGDKYIIKKTKNKTKGDKDA